MLLLLLLLPLLLAAAGGRHARRPARSFGGHLHLLWHLHLHLHAHGHLHRVAATGCWQEAHRHAWTVSVRNLPACALVYKAVSVVVPI
jgi:hypothetical protein